MRSLLLAALLAASPLAHAQIEIFPPAPVAGESITIRVTSTVVCPALARDGLRLGSNNVLEVTVRPSLCNPVQVARRDGLITIGQLPAGSYTLNVRAEGSSPIGPPLVGTAFTVGPYPDIAPVSVDLTGQWLTDNAGEGVTIVQSGEKMFILLVTYDAAGRQKWYVVPDAKRNLDGPAGDLPVAFKGTIFETSGFEASGAGGTVTFVGFAELYIPPPEPDRATLGLLFRAPGLPLFRSVPLRRFRF